MGSWDPCSITSVMRNCEPRSATRKMDVNLFVLSVRSSVHLRRENDVVSITSIMAVERSCKMEKEDSYAAQSVKGVS